MNQWISKAVNVFKRDVPETPQPFDVICDCGQKHAGLRRVRYQHLVCKACGASLFVLPRDTYPPPHFPQEPSKKKKKRRTSKQAATPVPLDFSEPVVQDDRHQPVPAIAKEVYDEDVGPGFVERQIEWTGEFFSAAKDEFVSFWTPYRKLAAAICCLLALTAFVVFRQNVRANAETTSREKFASGLAFLSEGQWTKARDDFEQSASAVNILGRSDLEANDIRQYARETLAMTRLGDETLFDIVEDAEATYVRQGSDAWISKFESDYENDWMIIEGTLRPTTRHRTRDGEPALELVFPWVVGERFHQVRVYLEFPLAVHLPPIGNVENDGAGNIAVFAAQLAGCELSPQSEWIVTFEPQSAFFWVHSETYAGTHLEIGSVRPESEVSLILRQQARWMGVRQ